MYRYVTLLRPNPNPEGRSVTTTPSNHRNRQPRPLLAKSDRDFFDALKEQGRIGKEGQFIRREHLFTSRDETTPGSQTARNPKDSDPWSMMTFNDGSQTARSSRLDSPWEGGGS